MLKKLLISAMAALAVSSHATPLYLTFEGTVAFSYDYAYSTMVAPALGTSQTIVMLVDQDAVGYYNQYGNTYTEPVLPKAGNDTYFRTELISGPNVTGGLGNPTTGGMGDPYGITYHYGTDYGYNQEGFSFAGSGQDQSGSENHISLGSDPSVVYTDIEVGQIYFTFGKGRDVTGFTTQWYGNFTLTNISATINGSGVVDSPVAVPEPSSLFLIGFGLAGLAGAARKRGRPQVS